MWFSATACIVACIAALGVGAPRTVEAQTDHLPPGRAARPPLELGAQTSLLAIFPAFGGLVSIPATPRVSVEAGVETIPWMIEDFDDVRLLSQLQARLAWRERGRSRRSFVVGASLATVGRQRRGWEILTTVVPHAGVSWQWRQSAHVDLRLDLQALVPIGQPGVPVPRVALSIIGHRRGGRL